MKIKILGILIFEIGCRRSAEVQISQSFWMNVEDHNMSTTHMYNRGSEMS